MKVHGTGVSALEGLNLLNDSNSSQDERHVLHRSTSHHQMQVKKRAKGLLSQVSNLSPDQLLAPSTVEQNQRSVPLTPHEVLVNSLLDQKTIH